MWLDSIYASLGGGKDNGRVLKQLLPPPSAIKSRSNLLRFFQVGRDI